MSSRTSVFPPPAAGKPTTLGSSRRVWRRWTVAPLLVLIALSASATPALATGDINQSACPAETEASPGFRSTLPDCRAYELVSPPYKQGFEPKIEAISEDGEHVIMRSLGGFAGLEGGDTREGAKFELSRSVSGWEVSPLSPPTSMFPAQELDAASSDLSKTLFSARSGSESVVADNFYLREANGTIVKVGPFFPPAATAGPAAGEYDSFRKGQTTHYVDASADLSHVLYSMYRPPYEHDAWPGDTTVGEESLLEYSGTGNTEPELVGVKPGEAKHLQGEDPTLISTCLTSLGSPESSDVYNAVSAEGDSVFFTAGASPAYCENSDVGPGPEVNELYARLNGRETVPISEPSEQACTECQTSAKAPAEFAGASQDGSKVFFLTGQELLPGATGSDLYEYDFDALEGERVLRVATGSATPEVQGVARVSEDGSHVYFVARGVLSTEPDRSLPAGRQQALAGADNLYVSERDAAHPSGRVSFIATLCSGEEQSGAVPDAQCPSAETDASDWRKVDERQVQATPDGRFVVFQSVADLTEGDTSSQPQIFEYDSLTGELVRVSRGAANDQPQGTVNADAHASEIELQGYANRTSPAASSTGLAVSADGATVVFSSTGTLTREAASGYNIYEYRSTVADGGTLEDGDVYFIGGGGPRENDLDASGQDVFFISPSSLVPQDTDTELDFYDARSDGGFPGPVSPVVCSGEACQGAPSPALLLPSAIGTPAEGNLTPVAPVVVPPAKSTKKATAVKCKKGFTKKRDRCVKNRKKRNSKRAGNNGRTKS